MKFWKLKYNLLQKITSFDYLLIIFLLIDLI